MKTITAASAALLSLASAASAQQQQSGPFYLVIDCAGNSTAGAIVSDPNTGKPGTLTYILPVNGGNESESEGGQLLYNQASNVALALFEPTSYFTQVAFDKDSHMNTQSYVNDTAVPAQTGTVAYNRWHLCQSYHAGYQCVALSWVAGKDAPQNPSCEKVEVVRKFLATPA